MKRTLMPWFALLTLAGPAAAQEVDCANALTQMEMNHGAEVEWQAADADLNAAYAEAVAEMRAIDAVLAEDLRGGEAALRQAQRAWVAFRDANCAAAGYPMRGGSAEPLLIYGCLRQMTVDRTEDLRALAEV